MHKKNARDRTTEKSQLKKNKFANDEGKLLIRR